MPSACGTQSPTICTVAGNVVSVLAGGNCAISAAQAGNLNYTAAMTLVQYVTVNQGSQIIAFPAPPTPIAYAANQTFSVAATGGASGNPVVFSSSTNPVCTVSGSVVGIVKAGTCTIAASQAGNAQYNAATAVGQTVVINKANQTIAFDPLPSRPLGSGIFTLSATASSGLTVTFTSRTTGKCTVASGTVTLVATGTCTIRAAQSGNVNYNAAPVVDQSFGITAGGLTGQVIGGFNPATPIPYQPAPSNTFTLTATGGGSGNPVTFTSSTASVCTTGGTNGATVTVQTAGTCTLNANQAGNASYSAAAQVSVNVVIDKAGQTITFATLADKQEGDVPFTVSATATSTLAVAFSSTTPTVCTVAGNTVTLLAAGTCSVKADQGGNGNYLAAPSVTRSFTVNGVAKVYFIHADHLGTPRAITKSSDNAKVWEGRLWAHLEERGRVQKSSWDLEFQVLFVPHFRFTTLKKMLSNLLMLLKKPRRCCYDFI